ncbi:Conserved_hypothetical protein [Hexamita inflata]|uniref:Uncharacterized protein n=1 Tax=Hexamita inflata TaxID=28002 RepID=A0AA86NB16_9EUKA|nr:Conserved hypothetical protein [Hexamita inflata]
MRSQLQIIDENMLLASENSRHLHSNILAHYKKLTLTNYSVVQTKLTYPIQTLNAMKSFAQALKNLQQSYQSVNQAANITNVKKYMDDLKYLQNQCDSINQIESNSIIIDLMCKYENSLEQHHQLQRTFQESKQPKSISSFQNIEDDHVIYFMITNNYDFLNDIRYNLIKQIFQAQSIQDSIIFIQFALIEIQKSAQKYNLQQVFNQLKEYVSQFYILLYLVMFPKQHNVVKVENANSAFNVINNIIPNFISVKNLNIIFQQSLDQLDLGFKLTVNPKLLMIILEQKNANIELNQLFQLFNLSETQINNEIQLNLNTPPKINIFNYVKNEQILQFDQINQIISQNINNVQFFEPTCLFSEVIYQNMSTLVNSFIKEIQTVQLAGIRFRNQTLNEAVEQFRIYDYERVFIQDVALLKPKLQQLGANTNIKVELEAFDAYLQAQQQALKDNRLYILEQFKNESDEWKALVKRWA